MNCPRCVTGLMVAEPWYDAGGNRGEDAKCVQCGYRVGVKTDTGYGAERPCVMGKLTRWSEVRRQ